MGSLWFLLKGLLIGFSIAAPVGPIGVLCIRRTLTRGRVSGFACGMGAATADAIYGVVAGFGLTFVSGVLIGQQQLLRLVGGAFLCYLGARALLARPVADSAPENTPARGDVVGAYSSTFFLTLTNPMTILSFAAIFAGLGVGSYGGDYVSAGLLVLGVFTGSALWWLILSGGADLFRTRLDPRRNVSAMLWINRISGVVILGFGLAALGSLAFG